MSAAPQASQTQLTTVQVTGHETADNSQVPAPYAGGQIAPGGRIGVLGEQDGANVPFSVISFTSQLIRNQQDHTVGDVLLNDASVQTAFGFGNFAQLFQIRGFTLDGEDISFGGLYGVLPRQIVQTNFVNRVELFKGANAFANGVPPSGSGVGGAVNLEPKRAGDTPNRSLRLGYGSTSQFEQALDLGQRFGRARQFGVRVNVEHDKGDTAIHDENAADTSAAIGLDYRGDRARASLDFGYQHQHIKHGRNVVYIDPSLRVIPRAPDANTNYAPSFASSELESKFGMLRGEYDLLDHWTAYAAVGANTSDEKGQYGSPTLINGNGDATVYRLGVPYQSHAFTGQAGIRGQFDTGPISHQLNVGYSGYYRKTSSAFTFSDLANQAQTNIYDPADIGFLPTTLVGGDIDHPNVRSRTRANGWSFSDTLGAFHDRLLFTVGGRYQAISIKNYGYDGVFDNDPQSGHRVSPVYGLVYKPLNWLSLYANHIEALQPGDAAPAVAINAGKSLGIVHAKQNEVGTKLDFGRVGGGVSLYEIKKPNAYLDPQTNIYGYFGSQKNRGIEVNLYGQPVKRLTLLTSATWVDSKQSNTAAGANDGNQAIGVPDYRLVLGGDWQLPGLDRWTANARVIRSGAQYVDAANQLHLPGWTRVDLGVRYRMPLASQKQVVWRANVENVANADYWASGQGGYLSQGDPRTFRLSATVDF